MIKGRYMTFFLRGICIFLLLFAGNSAWVLYSRPFSELKSEDSTPFTPAESGMGYVSLLTDKSFASQVITPNTIYEIRYDFDLGAKSVVIPQGCVLYFTGGTIKNGTIVGQNTHLAFVAGEIGCKLSGSFDNDSIHMEWFGIKSGKEYARSNDRILASSVIPSMESIGNALYMNPQTDMYFRDPLVFNGSYNLDLRGLLIYSGTHISTAISVGTPNTRTSGKSYKINSVVAENTLSFYNNGIIKESIGICFWNLKHCNINVVEVLNFAYCVRLCGNVGGCSSNIIQFTRIGGNCYYGIHCYSYDNGWENENTFYCKAIMNHSNNPAKDEMCAIWLDAEGKHSCNANVFYGPCVENCHLVVKQTNAKYNVIYDARTEQIFQAMISDKNSRDNTLYCKYWNRTVGDYSSYGSNRVIKQSEVIPPLVQVFSEHLGPMDSQYFGVCFTDGKLRSEGWKKEGFYFGRIVEIYDNEKDANIEFVFEQPGRFCIVLFNDDYTLKYVKKPDELLLRTDVKTVLKNGIILGSLDARRISVRVSKNCKKMLIGAYSGSGCGDVISMNIFSDNLIVDDLYNCVNKSFTLEKPVSIDALFYESVSKNFFSSIETVKIESIIDLKKKKLILENKQIYIGKKGTFKNGSVDITGSAIYPNFNALIDCPDIDVKGMPSTGTFYFQGGRPTWSNGTTWVDANGKVIGK